MRAWVQARSGRAIRPPDHDVEIDERKGWGVRGWGVLFVLLPMAALAQSTPQPVDVEPVTCWWRTNATAARVGEPFTVLLTCSLLETEAARAVVDRSQLGPASVQFPPYEVVGGAPSTDHVTVGRRFLQYAYTLRLINEDSFGLDVPIPPLEIEYRIESRVQQDTAVQGRAQTYILPPIPMRVASLVSDHAAHIRESAVPTLDEVGAREFRAQLLRVLSFIAFVMAALVALTAGRLMRARRVAVVGEHAELLPARSVLAGVARELSAVQETTRGVGWTGEAVSRALAAARIAASYAAGGVVSQRAGSAASLNGELAVGRRGLVRRWALVSGAATPSTIRRFAQHHPRQSTLEPLEGALTSLTRARYGRAQDLHHGDLDSALAVLVRETQRVAGRHTWRAERMAALQAVVQSWMPKAWAR
ncbi:MAG: hypothetical protein ACT4QD_11085 [Acidobacteriota bacterium]